jgi:2-amino-4-hydroxy-6-hydroxymethyldihydropteridine diphosphokinase
MPGDAILERAAQGELPSWACVSDKRRDHIQRVAGLIGEWSRQLAPKHENRWRAAAWLHDSLRDAKPDQLARLIDPHFEDWHPSLQHGPAAASQLRRDGLDDQPVLLAVAYHTVGHPDFDLLGRCLYLADYLEPGRKFAAAWRAELRALMPDQHEHITREVAAARIKHLIDDRTPLRPETMEFWNQLVSEQS